MPISFLTPAQRENYGRYAASPTPDQLSSFFHLSDDDLAEVRTCRGEHNRLGFALQLSTVRFLGTFLDDPVSVPSEVVDTLAHQLGISKLDTLPTYGAGKQRWDHAARIQISFGYSDITEPRVGFRLTRWLYVLCWTGTERPSVLFDRAVAWLLTHKILLPGCSTLERFVLRVRSRVENRVWHLLGRGIRPQQRKRLESLLMVPEGRRGSLLDQIRSGPTRASGPAMSAAIDRLRTVRGLGIVLPALQHIPESRLASLASFANRAKVSLITRMPPARRLATLAAFVYSLEATAQDDVLEVLEGLLGDLFGDAANADKKARLRSLKDLDEATATLVLACRWLIDPALADDRVRAKVFESVPKEALEEALERASALIRPPDDVFYKELDLRYGSVRRYLPEVLNHVAFEANPAGRPVVEACRWLRDNMHVSGSREDSSTDPAPLDVVGGAWQRSVVREDGGIDVRAYTFCTLDRLATAIQRRDVFTKRSWRYADPRANLLSETEWKAMRSVVCRSLGWSPQPAPVLDALSNELDRTYRDVAKRLSKNPAVRFETVDGKKELILTPLEKLEEPASLVALRAAVAARLPRLDLPEIVMEIAARTEFTKVFTHLTERAARVADLTTSVCAVLTSEACNTGPEPFIRYENPALRRDRLAWVKQHYVLAHRWGGGEVASADGMRFVVPVRTIHAGPNPKYFGQLKGVTWYNLLSDQFAGLNAIVTPGTLRDSLVLLAVVLEQQTGSKPTQIMTDTGAYSDVVFGLFRLLGYRFSPRLADMGGTRFWRIDPKADYGDLNDISRHRLSLKRITPHWDDMLRLAGSLQLGRVPATGIMRTLQVGDRPTRLAQAIAEFGRIEKTLHTLNMLDDESKRRSTLGQLNRGEGRHSLGRAVFHGKRGELRQRYREGQEDQLGALGLVVNMIVLWNTIYIEAALEQLRKEGFEVCGQDVARLSPLIYDHVNMLGRYSFAMPDVVAKGGLRPLRDPADRNA
jgi:TnpA family transposase